MIDLMNRLDPDILKPLESLNICVSPSKKINIQEPLCEFLIKIDIEYKSNLERYFAIISNAQKLDEEEFKKVKYKVIGQGVLYGGTQTAALFTFLAQVILYMSPIQKIKNSANIFRICSAGFGFSFGSFLKASLDYQQTKIIYIKHVQDAIVKVRTKEIAWIGSKIAETYQIILKNEVSKDEKKQLEAILDIFYRVISSNSE